jgi:hypothetical protein
VLSPDGKTLLMNHYWRLRQKQTGRRKPSRLLSPAIAFTRFKRGFLYARCCDLS